MPPIMYETHYGEDVLHRSLDCVALQRSGAVMAVSPREARKKLRGYAVPPGMYFHFWRRCKRCHRRK